MKQIILYFLLSITLSLNAQLKGKIVKVQDGDTVTLLDSDNTQHKIRLNGIDAPENGQPYGDKSKEYLSNLIFGKTVTVEYKKKDQYKRILGVIYLGEVNINAEMIRSGYAWNYKYSRDKYYIKLQEKAKADKRGLWKDENAIDPWQWRKEMKGQYSTSEAKIYTNVSTPRIYHRTKSCPELTKYNSEIIEHSFGTARSFSPCNKCNN